MRRYALRNDNGIESRICCLVVRIQVGTTAKDNCLFVEAVLYRYQAGIPWRDIPEHFEDFRVIHTRHTRWNKTGAWKKIFNLLFPYIIKKRRICLIVPHSLLVDFLYAVTFCRKSLVFWTYKLS